MSRLFEDSPVPVEVSTDRREERRFNLNAPVHFTWRLAGSSGSASQDGTTRDISLRGVFVLAGSCPPVGSVIRMSVVLPVDTADSNLEMRASATVVRVEATGSREFALGFAAVTRKYSLVSRNELSRETRDQF